jgi:predicted dinucleotide-binding enzyme
MSYAIIGFGNIGDALAKAFARNGIEVSVATTRDPESFAADVAASLPSLPKTQPYMVAGESCSWRATMTLPQKSLVRLRKISVSCRSTWRAF